MPLWASRRGGSTGHRCSARNRLPPAVAGQKFDIAMLDMNLGGSDSGAVAEALERHGVPFVYCTGNRAGNDAKGDLDRPVLRKPFSLEDLTAILSCLIQK